MNINADYIDELKKFQKPYLTTRDVERILNLDKKTASVVLQRLTKDKILIRVIGGIYRVFDRYAPLEKIASEIYYPSYVSFYYILGNCGVLNQKAYTISLATPRKSKKAFLEGRAIEYKQIKNSLFFGYFLTRDGFYEAYPEKALLDECYVVSLGKDHLDFDELNLIDLDKKKFKEYLREFPPKTKRLVKREIMPRWGTVSVTI